MKSINTELYKQIAEKIKSAIKEKNVTQEQIASKLNISAQQFQAYINKFDKNKIPLDYLIEIANFLNISPEYFYKKNQNIIPSASCISESQADDLSLDKSKYQTIPVYSFAGAGKFVNLTEIEPIDTLLVPKEFIKKKLAVVKVIGPSMEPYIKDGSYVGIDLNYKELVSGYIYCVNLDYEGALIKYVIKDRNGITLKSENPKFHDIFIKKEEIADGDHFVIGRVVWVWQNI
ncbi:MAG: XRE family transcriptional regulator [Candidatus Acidulodesulfobacterium acidiphilum]|uniref:XRE family transcriptional regulator n=1 Tax=Candidatus Acidulodesulfobacterium acidiphilum TaxID=2597224 RepID=A0A520XG77_9DELT|nr:MAG: XRE family transcriptional regulator [Candidatus Acidulodesulfobacterium acidiphilum]